MDATPDVVEREYNLRAAFPDHPEWIARWAADSGRARSALRSVRDLRYGAGPKQTIDLFPVENARGALLFIHGGYWRGLDKDEHSFIAPPFVAAGIGVAVANYDLCPAVRVGDIVEQCREAVDWLVREGGRHGVPARRMVVAGHSAGGHLTAMMFATDWKARGHDTRGSASGTDRRRHFGQRRLRPGAVDPRVVQQRASARRSERARFESAPRGGARARSPPPRRRRERDRGILTPKQRALGSLAALSSQRQPRSAFRPEQAPLRRARRPCRSAQRTLRTLAADLRLRLRLGRGRSTWGGLPCSATVPSAIDRSHDAGPAARRPETHAMTARIMESPLAPSRSAPDDRAKTAFRGTSALGSGRCVACPFRKLDPRDHRRAQRRADGDPGRRGGP